MCDVERFVARGSVIRNNSFHHTTCNLGRTKSSDSIIEHNTWAHGGSNMEITGALRPPVLPDGLGYLLLVALFLSIWRGCTGLENWMEGEGDRLHTRCLLLLL